MNYPINHYKGIDSPELLCKRGRHFLKEDFCFKCEEIDELYDMLDNHDHKDEKCRCWFVIHRLNDLLADSKIV